MLIGRCKHRREPVTRRTVRVAGLGLTHDQALELGCELIDRCSVDELHLTLQSLAGTTDNALVDAAHHIEHIWNETPCCACVHVAGPSRSALAAADLLVVALPAEHAQRCFDMLRLDASMLCPDAEFIIVGAEGATLSSQLSKAIARIS